LKNHINFIKLYIYLEVHLFGVVDVHVCFYHDEELDEPMKEDLVKIQES